MPVFRTSDFELARGARLPELEIAYEIYGALSPRRDNAILVAHGLTSTHIAAGPPTLDRRRGWYDEVIGPGKLFDTDRYAVLSSNTLGSCYGSTGPASRDPATGRPYGATFPEIFYEDIVRAQRALLSSLGVERLVAVAGSSIGGFQVFQWAVTFPEDVGAVIALDTAPRDTFDTGAAIPKLIETFASDPNWRGGAYHPGAMADALTALRVGMLESFGFEEKLGLSDAAERRAVLRRAAREWAEEFDPHSLIALNRAWARYDVEGAFPRISAPLLYVLCDTDEWFPASLGEEVMAKLLAAGVDARFHRVESALGHYATTEEPEKWVPAARAFLEEAAARPSPLTPPPAPGIARTPS